jgi:hypothetical protein
MFSNASTHIPPPTPLVSSKAALHAISLPAAPVAIKAPIFTERAPTAWFRILEAQFHLAGVGRNETKFYHALASLPPDLVSHLSTNILNNADYDDLKAAVCEHHESTKPELLDRFLSTTPMTGRPSHYLAEMRKLASQIGANDDLIRHKFQQVLPPLISPILMTQKNASLDNLGKLADELMTLNPVYDRVSSVSHVDRISRGKIQMNNPRQAGSPTSKSTSFNLTPFSNNQRPKVCRWHIFFGGGAKKCRPWCQWPNKQQCSVVDSRASSPAPSEN